MKGCLLPYSEISLNSFKEIYSYTGLQLERIYLLIHYVFKFEYIVGYCLAIFIILTIDIKGKDKFDLKFTRYLNIVSNLFVTTCLSTFIIIMIKKVFSCPRPFYYFGESFKMKENLYEGIRAWDSSFPSGHVALVSVILFSLWPYINMASKTLGILCLIITAISRVGLGLHFPHDVIGAILLCFVINIVSKKILKLRLIQRIINSFGQRILKPYLFAIK
jgi:membrane-associated phospholipid phosphatase